mgnify:FL=1
MIGLRVHKRREPLGWGSILVFLAAIVLSLAICSLLLAIQGKPAFSALSLLIKSAFFSAWAVEDCLVKSVPIFLCSLGVAIAFRLQVWNIGAEGHPLMISPGLSHRMAAIVTPQVDGPAPRFNQPTYGRHR